MKKILIFLLLLPSLGFAELSWNKISSNKPIGSKYVVYRASVPHGWLVIHGSLYADIQRNMVFVPDENHEWVN